MKGFRDFYPEDKRVQNYIFRVWKKVAERFGYLEVEGPLLEQVELYCKSGEEIPEQMYAFEDKSGRKVAIRPELTPTLARMVSAKLLAKPVKWYSIGRFLRYEAPQSGRLREFYQFNLDCFGSESMKADAEVIASAIEIMKEFGLGKKDFYVRISNRKLFDELLKKIGVEANKKKIAKLIDKKCKLSNEDFRLALKDNGLSDKQIKELIGIFAIRKIEDVKTISKGLDELKELFGYLENYGVLDYCRIDLSIVRGFDYYTGTVFEVFDAEEKFRAIAGGGRYDLLAKEYPAVGYAFGDIVLEMFLREKKKLPEQDYGVEYYVAPVNDECYAKALGILAKLRKENSAEIDLTGRKLGKQMEHANKIRARKVVIVGKEDKATVKDMKTGKEARKDL